MVVCKCRKATKLYCFVHKTPVCLDCVCSSDHEKCVVGLYSDWVNDGDYDWPPVCPVCSNRLDTTETETTRLGCLHVLHCDCLKNHLGSFPAHTAPAGFTCPAVDCHSQIWPPKSQKETATSLFTNLRSVIAASPASASLLTAAVAPPPSTAPPSSSSSAPPPAFSSPPLVATASSSSSSHQGAGNEAQPDLAGSTQGETEAAEAGGAAALPTDGGKLTNAALASLLMSKPATVVSSPTHVPQMVTRKGSSSFRPSSSAPPGSTLVDISGDVHMSHTNSHDIYSDDDDGSARKYVRRGPVHMQLLRYLASFWSPALSALPVTSAPTRRERDEYGEEGQGGDGSKGRRRTRSQPFDARKAMLVLAIGSCLVTMMLLYYRLVQASFETASSGQVTQI